MEEEDDEEQNNRRGDDLFKVPPIRTTNHASSEDDNKLSRLIRSLSRVESFDHFETTAHMVMGKLRDPTVEDKIYLSKQFTILTTTLADTFKALASNGSGFLSYGVEKLGGIIGEIHFVLETEEEGGGDRVFIWLIDLLIKRGAVPTHKKLDHRPPKHILLLHEIFIQFLDRISVEHVCRVPTHLLNVMDNLDDSVPFKILCTLFAHCLSATENWQNANECFPDFVDVVIGWMVDEESVEDNSNFCSQFLHLLRPYFMGDASFPKTLIKQISEDMETEAELERLANQNQSCSVVKRIMLLTKAYASMLRVNCVDDKTFVNELSERVIGIGLRVLNNVACSGKEIRDLCVQLLCGVNEVLTLSPGVDGTFTRTFIKTEIESLRHGGQWEAWHHVVISKVWEGICSWVESILSATQLSEDTLELAESLISFVDELGDSREKVLLVQTLLRTRSIPLLQKVYAWHLAKLDGEKGDELIPFVLAGIADIAGSKSSSILTLYALQPSILDLLISLAKREQKDIGRKRLILELLQVHCAIHSHWVASISFNSSSEFSSGSPGARFLPTLLEFWEEQLFISHLLTVRDKLWLLDWIYEFFLASPAYASVLYKSNPTFFHSVFQFICLSSGDHHSVIFKKEKTAWISSVTPIQSSYANATTTALCLVEGLADPTTIASTASTPRKQQTQIHVQQTPPEQIPTVLKLEKTLWPYLDAATKIFKLFTDEDSKYYKLTGLQEFLVSLCKTNLFPLHDNSCVHPDMKPLLTKVICRLPPLIISERKPASNSIHEEEEEGWNIINWTAKTNQDPVTVEEYSAFLMPSEFNGFIYELIFSPEGYENETDDDSNDSDEEVVWVTTGEEPCQDETRDNPVHFGEISSESSITSILHDAINPAPQSPTPFQVRAAVDFLLRSKLRTVLGKPTELFSQLHLAFRGEEKYENQIHHNPVPEWKLNFLFLLEQGFTLWGLGSYLHNIDLSESVRQFFIMNITPCIEWLKRIRLDLLDVSLASGHPHHAFYHGALADDICKAEVALFHIKDVDGLRGRENWQHAAWLYLQGNFEGALAALENSRDTSKYPNNELKELVSYRVSQILDLDVTERCLGEKEKIRSTLDFLLPYDDEDSCVSISILDSQLNFAQRRTYKGDHLYVKTTLDMELATRLGETLDVWTLLKVADAIQFLPEITMEQRKVVWLQLGHKMLECGNSKWVTRLLQRLGVNFDALLEPNSGDNSSVSGNNYWYIPKLEGEGPSRLSVGKLMAELLVQTNQFMSATKLFAQLLLNPCGDLIEPLGSKFSTAELQLPQTEEDLESRVSLLLKVAQGLGPHPKQLTNLMEILGWTEEAQQAQTPTTSELIQFLEKALELGPIHPGVWLALGNALYDLPLTKEDNFSPKSKSLEAYCNHLRFSTSSSSGYNGRNPGVDFPLVQVISRVISIVKEDNGEELLACCDPSQIIISNRWLDFLPEIAVIPMLRPYVLQRFPRMAAMFLWAHDSSRTGPMSVATLGRKGLFDPLSSVLVDVNEEPFTSPISPSVLPLCCSNRKYKLRNSTLQSQYYVSRSHLDIEERIHILGRELLRVGTSSEELWSWTLQRVLSDWNKRISSLKKDMSRDPEQAKITAYVNPIISFLQEMWEYTVANSDSPAQFSFVVRNCDTIPSLLTSLRNCSSVDAVLRGFEKLLFHAETFDAFITYKSQLGRLSPKLANFKEWRDSVTLLGMPKGVHILGIHPVVFALATKTKPKKIRFQASNGKSYEYLVKGNENLNVDAGMMQLLTLCQTWLKQPVWTYAVTPLGNRGGLIQMVQGATPVFQLYKKYLHKTLPGEKTSEIFWKRMAAFGVIERSRSAADSFTLKQVFLSLLADSPKDLISRELLLASPNPRHWFKAVTGFTRDSGISAAIGYLFGIGDRHLDNILVDVEEGKLVHVDFSLVFGRGEKLRVPEVVPFRLTHNFQEALQYPGVDGAFSAHMEATLSSFQTQKELASFCARNIAFACQIEEDFIANPTSLLVTEVNSAFTILQLRYKAMLKSITAHRLELVTASEDLTLIDTSVKDMIDMIGLHESAIEQLTIALSNVKNAQYDPIQLKELHSRCKLKTEGHSSSPIDAVLYHLSIQLTPGLEPLIWASGIESLLSSNLQSEVKLKFEASTKSMALTKERLEKMTLLAKKVNKWRRLLGNLDPLLTFISHQIAIQSPGWSSFKSLVEEEWAAVAHQWLHTSVEDILIAHKQVVSSSEMVELTLQHIFHCVYTQHGDSYGVGTVTELDLTPVDPNLELVQWNLVEGFVAKLREKVKGFNVSSSVDLLMNEASSESNLCKMFEGWTPWI